MDVARRAASAAHETFVELRDVHKTYDGHHFAVAGVSCTIARGEFLTFLGPSGSGKTTALMMLAGFEVPTRGDILLQGHTLARVPPHRRNMGVVFQSYALFPHMTVAENVGFPLSVRGISGVGARERIARALQLVDLPGLERRRPSELSGGQQQRVALARALIFDPDIVLMDEPLGALDKQLREQLQIEIKSIQRQLGVTVVYVTHDQSEALTMSDRIAVFHRGAIQQIDTPQALYDRPASAFVAQFVGQNNLLEGVIESVEEDYCLVRTRGERSVIAQLVGRSEPGSSVVLCVRPEDIEINPTRTGPNVFGATLRDCVYYGDHLRTRVVLPGNEELSIKIERSRPMDCTPGRAVHVSWLPEKCRVLPAESSPVRPCASIDRQVATTRVPPGSLT
jgi:putative spermidine/putrescine transport system ATP-binding protein